MEVSLNRVVICSSFVYLGYIISVQNEICAETSVFSIGAKFLNKAGRLALKLTDRM
jgi:hypothetical protein